MGPNEDTVEVLFPTNGIDTAGEFSVQRPNTTPSAVNVRSCDPLQERMRGGSRHGLIKFIDDELPNTEAFVQTFEVSGDVTTTVEWEAPPGLDDTISVEMWAGGGQAPDTAPSGTSGQRGGGGGGYARLDAFPAVSGSTYQIVIGAGADEAGGGDGGNSTFNFTSAIAVGGKSDGTGGTGSTGDVTFAGGAGGVSGVALGGGGGGGGAGDGGAGSAGSPGTVPNFGGVGGAGGAGANPGGAGGNGATGDPGSEFASTAGTEPGGGGGGGATDQGGDPLALFSAAGAHGRVFIRYRTFSPMQHLAQLVTYNADFLGSSFEYYSPDFIPDPSTNNGGTIRNPGRSIPPGGAGDPPSRTRPLTIRRRIQAVASPTTQVNGSNVTVTSTLTALPGSTAVGSVLVRMRTVPRGRDGDGDTQTTNGSGIGVFTVNEPTYEGLITYITQHQYTNATTGQLATVTGYTQVVWRPNYTLTLVSVDGSPLSIYSGSHVLLASLTNTATGSALPNRRIGLRTNGTGRVGDLTQKFTNGSGNAAFTVSSAVPEAVIYTASLASTSGYTPTITDDETIVWEQPAEPPLEPFPPPPPPAPTDPATVVTWVVESSVYYNTVQGKDQFIYSVRRYINGVATGSPFTILATVGTNVLCCLPAIRCYGGPNIPGLTGLGVVATMYGAECPTTVLANDAYVIANCMDL